MTEKKTEEPIRRSWWNRVVPIRIRHNIRLIFGSVLVLAMTTALLGSFQVRPIVFSDTEMLPTITNNVEGSIDFFDHSVPHSIQLEVSDISYELMISDFKEFGEKTMVEANIIIDGTFLPSVGIRLKGNSTLMQISGRIPRQSPPSEDGSVPMNDPLAESAEDAGISTTRPSLPLPPSEDLVAENNRAIESVSVDSESGSGDSDAAATTEEPPEPPSPLMLKMFGLMGGATEEDPSTLPLLLSFDEFFPGRGYQGRTELSLRPVAGGGASLNEALSLQLIADSGQVSQKYSWTTFSMNGGVTRTRLVLENPNQNYASSMGLGRGVLYKSRNSNAFEYHGDDPTLYVEDYLQLNAIGSRDISPVIRFHAWLDSASDEVFENELAEWLEIKSFAEYVVTQDLLDNFDDMAGPGRNFLFWYDLDDKKFTVVNWDMNLAMVGVGAVFDGRQEEQEAERAAAEVAGEQVESGIRFGNTLKDRFTENATFAAVIADTRTELLEHWFGSGHAITRLGELADYVPVTDRLNNEQIESQIASLTEIITTIE